MSPNNHKISSSQLSGLLAELGIVPDRKVGEFYRDRTKPLYTSPATDKGGRRTVFRIGLNEDFSKIIDKEICLYQNSEDIKLNCLPVLTDHGIFEDCRWLTYQYIEGAIAGNVYQYKLDIDFDLILDFLADLYKIDLKNEAKLFLKPNGEQYWNWLLEESFRTQNPVSEDEKMLQLRRKLRASILKIKTSTLVHGDFHAQNIFFQKDQIKIIDWETSHFNSLAVDYSFLYIRAYDQKIRQRIWQSLLQFDSTIEQEARVVFLIRLLRELREWYMIKDGKNELLDKKDLFPGTDIQYIIKDLKTQIELFSNKI